jgi:hypothetical protein
MGECRNQAIQTKPDARRKRLNLALGDADLGVAVDAEEEGVLGNELLEDLFDAAEVEGIDDGVGALLEGLHGVQALEGIANEDDEAVAALDHGHVLDAMEGHVLDEGRAVKALFDDGDLVLDLAEAIDEILLVAGDVNFEVELVKRGAADFEVIGSGKAEQRGLVRGADEIEFGHGDLF